MFNNAIRHFIPAFSLILTLPVQAQNLTKSPYSFAGMGELHFPGNAKLYAMGQTGQGLRPAYEFNILNPASYSALQQTVFEAGAFYTSGMLSTANASNAVDNSSFAYFNLGMPLWSEHGIGLAFGLQPYSTMGYNLSSPGTYQGSGDSLPYKATTFMQGRGGLSRFYMGTGVRIHKNISIGIQVSYLFGNMTTAQQLVNDTAAHKFDIAEERNIHAGDLGYSLGIQYHKGINEKYRATAGLTLDGGTTVNAKGEHTVRSTGWGASRFLVSDTLFHVDAGNTNIRLPLSLNAGVGFERKDKWSIIADLHYTQWEFFRLAGVAEPLYKNSLGISAGASIIPDMFDYKNYLKRIEYRIGGRYDNGNLNISGMNIAMRGVSAGLGLPLGKSRSKLNMSFEYFIKGTTENQLIKESYYRLVIGLTITDKWFIRPGYD